MKRITEIITPAFLKRWDQQLLQNRPGIWATRIHYQLYYALVFNVITALFALVYPVNTHFLPDVDTIFGLWFIPCIVWLCVYVYHTVLFNVPGVYGQVRSGYGQRNLLIYFIAIALICTLPYNFSSILITKTKNLYEDEELITLIKQLDLGSPYFPGSASEYEYYPSEQSYVEHLKLLALEDSLREKSRDIMQWRYEDYETYNADKRKQKEFDALIQEEYKVYEDGRYRWKSEVFYDSLFDYVHSKYDLRHPYNEFDDLRNCVYKGDCEQGFAPKKLFFAGRLKFSSTSPFRTASDEQELNNYWRYTQLFQCSADERKERIQNFLKASEALGYGFARVSVDEIDELYEKGNYSGLRLYLSQDQNMIRLFPRDEDLRLRVYDLKDRLDDVISDIVKNKKWNYDFFDIEVFYAFFVVVLLLSILLLIFKLVHWKQFLLSAISFPLVPILLAIICGAMLDWIIRIKYTFPNAIVACIVILIVVSSQIPKLSRYRVFYALNLNLLHVLVPFLPFLALGYMDEILRFFRSPIFDGYLETFINSNGYENTEYSSEYSALKDSLYKWSFWGGVLLYYAIWLKLFYKSYLRLHALPRKK